MSALSAFFASLLAAWPSPAGTGLAVEGQADDRRSVAAAAAEPGDPLAAWMRLSQDYRVLNANQVRIEQRIIWRVAPLPDPARQSLLAVNPEPRAAAELVERKMGDCIPMSSIAGGRPQSGTRLLLFLRDRRLVAANLEKACSARDFYSGFYVDKPNSDGKLCADRDRILARNGARCEISSFRQLVADD